MPNIQTFRLPGAFALLACFLGASPRAISAQQPETRVVPVTVIAADGKAVTNLQSRNIRLRGRDMQLKSFSADAGPRRIVLLLDTSGSMGEIDDGKPRLEIAIRLVNLFLDNVPAGDLVGLYQFSDKPREIVPFTKSFAEIRRALGPISPSQEREMLGYTNIGDVLNAILTNSQEPLGFGDAIVIFSDGEFDSPNGKHRTLSSVGPALVRRGVRVFLALAQEKGTVPSDTGAVSEGTQSAHGITQLSPAQQRMATQTGATPVLILDPEAAATTDAEIFVGGVGGESFAPASYSIIARTPEVFRSNDLTQRMESLSGAVQSTYRLDLQFSGPVKRKKRLHLEVVDGRGKALHNVTVLSPEFVYPHTETH
jgi:Mg-chelatase subunit ChlD